VGFRYFEKLNYTLANEDASLETEALPEGCERVVAVGGSGARILPLLSKGPREIHVVDISRSQLALCELRLESLRKLSHSEFIRFWYPWIIDEGSASLKHWRRLTFQEMNLSDETRKILLQVFERSEWDAVTLSGKWEKTFGIFSKLARLILGRRVLNVLFEFDSLQAQREYIRNDFPRRRFRGLVALVGNARTFNAMLYRGSFPRNNSGVSYVDYYEQAYYRLFEKGLARENFFLQLSLLGKPTSLAALPIEADPVLFEKAKKHLPGVAIHYHQSDIISFISETREIDFVSLSNVPAYFSGELEQEFLSRILGSLRPRARVVIRHYLHYPESLDRRGYHDLTSSFAGAIGNEKIQMYDPEILERVT